MRPRAVAGAVTLAAMAVAGVPVVAPAGADAATSDDSVSVILLSVDALHPAELDEVGDDGNPIAPTLQRLRDEGTWWTQARSVMAAETLPNHVAMATGTYPGFTSIPGNDGRLAVGDTGLADPDLGVPEARTATSTIAAIEAQCPDLRTVTSLSKEYVWRTFVGEADEDFDQPSANIPQSGHAPEAATVPYLLEALQAGPVDHAFVNLGDHDRAGHIDATGAAPGVPDGVMDGAKAGQRAALGQADQWIAQVVAELEASGAWERTVLLLVSDHSMDFSIPAPTYNVDVDAALEQVETANGHEPGSVFLTSYNGGAAFVYLLDPSMAGADDLLVEAHAAIGALTGVDEVLYRLVNPADPDGATLATRYPWWNLHQTDRAGDILVLAQPRYRMGAFDETYTPGTHGHLVTRHSTALVTGGWDGIVAGQVVDVDDAALIDLAVDTERFPGQAEQVDWAPTIGWLLGVEDPGTAAGGSAQWRGRVLEEAFSRQPAVRSCAAAAGGGGGTTDDPISGAGGLAATGGGLAAAAVAALALGASVRPHRRRRAA